MRSYVTLFICILSSALLFGQQEDAKKLLQKVKDQLVNQKNVQYDYKMIIEIPESQTITMNGFFKKKGDKYHATFGDRWVKSNGETQWIYDPDLNEVQIYNAEDGNGLPISPEMITELYESDDYEYAITGKEMINGREVILIEFKSMDPEDEYFKMRLALESASAKPLYFKVFEKNGSRYSLEIDKIKDNVQFNDSEFTFEKANHPGISIEDLRM